MPLGHSPCALRPMIAFAVLLSSMKGVRAARGTSVSSGFIVAILYVRPTWERGMKGRLTEIKGDGTIKVEEKEREAGNGWDKPFNPNPVEPPPYGPCMSTSALQRLGALMDRLIVKVSSYLEIWG